MTEATLFAFRNIADQMGCNGTWKWIGPHLSQRMFGITEARAKDYAQRFGGEASHDAVALTAAHCEARK